jgi:uncharacterized membrane protein YgdD (TMEM256/DUF423 family)
MLTYLTKLSALLAALAVICGAFGAHGLRDVVPASDLIIWEKAVFYHLIHAVAALITALAAGSQLLEADRAIRAAIGFIASLCIFSGSLYILVLLNIRWLGAITPIGGAGLIATWLFLAWALGRKPCHR